VRGFGGGFGEGCGDFVMLLMRLRVDYYLKCIISLHFVCRTGLNDV